ncbi:lycopene cyclase [Flavobacterium sp. CYK-4]|uniref:lycopene cyclase family protein n=1 Tax=Flavobacterium lotistagni TaxID=2709660 RepID=UPI00140BF67D|nr:lycopene cyclase family protein [Flavobacterium lotistagni]NHM07837.1 lycopene cyclase [Flavobacterium lotistagni]
MQHYHYIFTGGGLSAMMVVYEMVKNEKFSGQSILIIDADDKQTNDRTWCFWDEQDDFDGIVSKSWNQAVYADTDFRKVLDLKPYQYKMIQGKDFYDGFRRTIEGKTSVHFLQQKVLDFHELGQHCIVKTDTQSFTCNKVFNSIFNPEMVRNQKKYPLLQQHFVGWFVKTKSQVFNPIKATFMDFSVAQNNNTRFMYVLPFSETEALVEYTLFSKELLPREEYETAIAKYLENIGAIDFEITEKEHGNIPMTVYPFWKQNTKNIIHIGSAGGWTKASTGYTFKNTVKKSKALVQFLATENDFRKFHQKNKFWFYDLLFIDVLSRRNDLGSTVFSGMFCHVSPALIFKFLDEETTFAEDLKIIWSCPKKLFIRALLGRLF